MRVRLENFIAARQELKEVIDRLKASGELEEKKSKSRRRT